MQTGSIIDFYDDVHGLVLKTKLGAEQVPEFVKTAQFLDDSHRDKLPDDVFALVMVDQGEKFRKYACVDKGNAALSVLYFLENGDRLPEEAQKVAAANLMTACEWYDLQPPAPLVKAAGIGGALMGAALMQGNVSSGVDRHNKAMGKMKVGDLTGSNIMPNQSGTEKTASADKPGFLARLIGTDKSREYDVQEAMEYAKKQKAKGVKGYEHLYKKASLQPYVDVTGKSAPPRMEKVAHQRFALVKEGQGRFPIDSYGDVIEADRWFNDHGETLHPEDRREMCIKLAARAEEIGCKVTDYVRKYAGKGYATDGEIKVAVATRMQYFQDDSPERDMLNGLMDKYAHVSPDVFCEAVCQFDQAMGLDHHWDDGVYDPWYTTYGFTKVAEWSFSTHGDKINEEQLKQVVNASYPLIAEKFGDEMANSLKKSPVSIFSSLPLDTKRILMRMANDPQPSPALVMS